MATKSKKGLSLKFRAAGKTVELRMRSLSSFGSSSPGPQGLRGVRKSAPVKQALAGVAATLHHQASRLKARFHEIREDALMVAPPQGERGVIHIPTQSLIVEQPRAAALRWLADRGFVEVQGGRRDKALFQAPDGDEVGIRSVFDAAQELTQLGTCASASPNLLRAVQRPAPSSSTATSSWHLRNDGSPGVPGADVHALAAWSITEGDAAIRVAVLDEGVDSTHPWLPVVAEADFVDNNATARPDRDDAHGTACAGIIASRHADRRGVAPGVSIVGVRIAKSDNFGFWIFDDFDTADAIDWSWDDQNCDVLSNSWGGGLPSDAIIRAFERARTQGRGGLGAVVAVAAGNEDVAIGFPADLPGMLTVGASNQWDKRKTKTSADGENWWASSHGPELDLVAPGVGIRTADIRGSRGYSSSMWTDSFNGTSSATPQAAAAAALILSLRPDLNEQQVRQLIVDGCDQVGGSSFPNPTVGHGRLNVYRALWLARRHP
jgi:subtilisin family serine protease